MTSEPAARAAERIVNNMVVPVLPLDKQTAGFRKVQAAEYAAIIRDEFAATLAAKDAEIAMHRKCGNYWWAAYQTSQGRKPTPCSSDPEQDAAIREMLDLHAEIASLRAEVEMLKGLLANGARLEEEPAYKPGGGE